MEIEFIKLASPYTGVLRCFVQEYTSEMVIRGVSSPFKSSK